MTACAVVIAGMTLVAVPDPALWVRLAWWALLILVMGGALWLRRRDRLAYERALAQAAAAQAVAQDRLAIARELHDVVSGGLGAITVRAAVAQRLETGPEGLRTALADVESASREATDGLRRMLDVLRDEDAARSVPVAPVAVSPAPTALDPSQDPAGHPQTALTAQDPGAGPDPAGLWAEMEVAVRRARRNGLTVDVSWQGEPWAVEQGPGPIALPAPSAPPALREAAVGVVCEALANTARHAGPVRVSLDLRWEPGWLRIAVLDDGPAQGWTPRPGTGRGLRGMRERVEALGGRLSAGPRDDGDPGFGVIALLPAGAPGRSGSAGGGSIGGGRA